VEISRLSRDRRKVPMALRATQGNEKPILRVMRTTPQQNRDREGAFFRGVPHGPAGHPRE
jgi:hypothetical protein